MKLTNKLNLPLALVQAVANDPYSKGDADLSVTQLIKPMRAVVLEQRHKDEITEDAAERLWSLYGQVAHGILERANFDKGVIAERRLFTTIQGLRVSGSMDCYYPESGHLADWKFTTAWKFLPGKDLTEWEQQLNCYAELLRQNGDKIESLEVIGLIRDYSKPEAKRNPNYPQLPVARVPFRLWSSDEALTFMHSRVVVYQKALGQLPNCSDKERWAEESSKWAVTSKASESSAPHTVKKHDTEEEALRHAANLQAKYKDKKYGVEYRPAENKRCDNYCLAANFCTQYQALKGNT